MSTKPDQAHVGAFYGNAVADWLGVLAFVIVTKYFAEVGSGESRKPSPRIHTRVGRVLLEHSLTIVLALTGIAWAVAYAWTDVDSRIGQVVGNIVSGETPEWSFRRVGPKLRIWQSSYSADGPWILFRADQQIIGLLQAQ